MRKIKEVPRLRFEPRLGQREIARACSISQGAVHNYLSSAVARTTGGLLKDYERESGIKSTGERGPWAHDQNIY